MIAYAFVFTLNFAVEFVIELVALRPGLWKRILVMALLLNLCTHPVFWFYMENFPLPWLPKLLLGELIVFAVEITLGLLFLRNHFSRARVITAVACANLATFLMTFLPTGI